MSKKLKIGLMATSIFFLIVAASYGGQMSEIRENPSVAMENGKVEIDPNDKGIEVMLSPSDREETIVTHSQSPVSASEKTSTAIKAQDEVSVGTAKDIVAVTFLGIDSSQAREAEGKNSRSDVIIVCAINEANNTVTAISVPRDTRASISVYDDKGEEVGLKNDKINSAYAYGKKNGFENALRAVSELLGVELKHYVSLDMDSISALADAIGGVEVTLDSDIEGIGEKGETVLLKGDNAMNFVRIRHGVDDGSDLSRIKRQQMFMMSLAQKLKSANTIKAMPSIIISMGGKIKTDLPFSKMLSLMKTLSNVKEDGITFVTLPGRSKEISGKSYFIVDKEGVDEIVKKAFLIDNLEE